MTSFILVTTRFEGIHFYENAPEEVAFLRFPHRHEFHVSVGLAVTHDDRELEFILVKRSLDQYISTWGINFGGKSCEMMAKDIIQFLFGRYGKRSCSVKVSEDGENGAVVEHVQ